MVGDAHPGVAHGEQQAHFAGHRRVQEGDLQTHLAALGEFDRVAHQVEERLAQAARIADEAGRHLWVHAVAEIEAFLAGGVLVGGGHRPHDLGQIEGLLGHGAAAGLQHGQGEHVGQDVQQVAPGLQGGAGEVFLLLIEAGHLQELDHAQEAVEGRADLVAHGGQELVLGAGGRFGLVPGQSQLPLYGFALGDVAEAPHASGDAACLQDGAGEALEHAAVRQAEAACVLLPAAAQALDAGPEGVGRVKLAQEVEEYPVVAGGMPQGLGHSPHVGEGAVEQAHPSLFVQHQDAVGRGLHRGEEKALAREEGGFRLVVDPELPLQFENALPGRTEFGFEIGRWG